MLAPVLIFLMIFGSQGVCAQTEATQEPSEKTVGLTLFTAPDHSSSPAGSLHPGEPIIPVAETLGAGGVTWYLVKSKTGVTGWLKKSDTEASKKIEQFFNSLPIEPSLAISTDISPVPSGSSPRSSITVPVQMNGPAVIVPVTLNRTFTTHMALDTGATRTVLSQRIAQSLGLNLSGSRAVVETANGRVAVAVARLASTKVGEAEVRDLLVTVHNFSSNPNLGGLLGLDFLRRFHVSLDSRKQLLVLSPR